MRARDPNPQHPGQDAEAKRGLEHQRLAVDAGGDRAFRIDLECRAPTIPATAAGVACRASPLPVGAEATVIPSRPSSIRGRVPEPTAFPSR